MISTWQNLNRYQVISYASFLIGVNETSSEIFRFINFKESNVAICKWGYHEWFKLMHCYSHAFLLWYYELELKFTVKHIPKLNYSIFSTASNHVILIKLIKFILLWIDLKLRWRNVLVVYAIDLIKRIMAWFKLHCLQFSPTHVPNCTRWSSHHTFIAAFFVAYWFREAIQGKCKFFTQEKGLRITLIKVSCSLWPTMNYSIIQSFNNDLRMSCCNKPDACIDNLNIVKILICSGI